MDQSKHGASLTNHVASQYNSVAPFVYSAAYTTPVLGLLNAHSGERIIDLGCGTGELTRIIKKAVGSEGEVVGIDSSESMLATARLASADIQYIHGDIQRMPGALPAKMKGAFDAIFTSAVLHWTRDDPIGVIKGMRWLLKPGGRVAFEFGGYGNVAEVRTALHAVLREKRMDALSMDPWFFPRKEDYAKMLLENGFHIQEISLVPRPTPILTDFVTWQKTFVRNSWLADLSDEVAGEIMDSVQEILRPALYWDRAHVGIGMKAGNGVKPVRGAADESPNEGWGIMNVRLRGLAISRLS